MLLPEWWFNPDLPTMIQSEQKKRFANPSQIAEVPVNCGTKTNMTALNFWPLSKSTLPNTGIIVQLHTNKTRKGGKSLKILMYICQAPGTLIPPNEKSTKKIQTEVTAVAFCPVFLK